MITICSYTLILLSVIYCVYNLSHFIDNFGELQKKVGEYRDIVAELDDDRSGTLRKLVIQDFLLIAAYTALAYFAGLQIWVLALIAIKFLYSSKLSNRFMDIVFKLESDVTPKFYRAQKIDALLNVLLFLFILLILVV